MHKNMREFTHTNTYTFFQVNFYFILFLQLKNRKLI